MEEQVAKIRLGISACLLGQAVRYDGGHKHDRFITETLGQYVDFVPVCPEVECGLGIPREAMRLVGEVEQPRLVTIRSRRDYTDQMLVWARQRVQELEREDLNGFIFKSDSPSSGMERVKVYNDKGMPLKKGIGLFAGPLWSTSRCCRWKTKAACTTRSCGKTSSRRSLPLNGGGIW